MFWTVGAPGGAFQQKGPPHNLNPKPITLPRALNCQSEPDLGTQSYLILQGSLRGGDELVLVGRPRQAKPSQAMSTWLSANSSLLPDALHQFKRHRILKQNQIYC